MRLALVGTGRMGEAVGREAEHRGHTIHARVGRAENPGGAGLTRERLQGVDVVVEFTRPDAVVANLERLIELGVPVVTGTTGWIDHLPRIAALATARNAALLHAPNFSIGIHLFFRAAGELARWLPEGAEFDASITEIHHRQKRDAPSGTALALQRAVRAADASREYPITSQRIGSVPGTHVLTVDGPHDSIQLTHTVRDRAVFAAGAVRAAEWLPGRRGVFTFDQMLFGGAP